MTDEFLRFALDPGVRIAMVAVDEAHCVSQWGQDFRPSYLKIVDFIKQLPARPVVSAFTATATAEVRDDIIDILMLRQPEVLTTGFDRSNLYFSVETPGDKYKAVLHHLRRHQGESGVIYCLTRKVVEEVCSQLIRDGYSVTRYHAGLSDQRTPLWAASVFLTVCLTFVPLACRSPLVWPCSRSFKMLQSFFRKSFKFYAPYL